MRILLMLVVLFACNFATAKKRVFLTHSKFVKMSPWKQGLYVEELQRAVLTLIKAYPELSEKQSKHSLYSILFKKVYAANKDVRCIYGGFVVLGEKCTFVSKYTLNKKESKCSGAAPVMCNPLLYGTNPEGKAFCVARSSNATEKCNSQEGMDTSKIVELIKDNKIEFDKFTRDLNRICIQTKDVALLKNNPGGIQDVKATCAKVEEQMQTLVDAGLDERFLDSCRERNKIQFNVSCTQREGNECYEQKCGNLRQKYVDSLGCYSSMSVRQDLLKKAVPKDRNPVVSSAKCIVYSENCKMNAKSDKGCSDKIQDKWVCKDTQVAGAKKKPKEVR